jgi:hypothetical protein
VTKTRAFLLTLIATALLDVVAARLRLPALWGLFNPIIVVRLALIAGIGAALGRTTGVTKNVILLATASVLPTILWCAVYILSGRAAAEYSGPAIVLAFMTWSLGTGIIGALAGAAFKRSQI